MLNEPSASLLAKLPRLYETEKIPIEDTIIHIHFFIGSSHWFIAEFDGDDLFFGFAILNGDLQNAEWGYVSFSELKSISVEKTFPIFLIENDEQTKSATVPISLEIEWDEHWRPVPFHDIPEEYQPII